MRGIMWFRADLRLQDNPALYAASLACGESLIAVYCLTPKTWQAHHAAACKVEFILRNLSELSNSLAKYHIPLHILEADHYSDCPRALLEFAKHHQIEALYFNKQYEYDELNRDEIAIKLFQSESLEVHDFDDQLILAPGRVLSQAKQAFKVFTPFKRKWWATLDEVDQRLVPLPKKQAKMLIAPSNVPRSLPGFRSAIDESLWPAGERYAHKQLEQFCERGLFDYSVNRDFPAIDGTSRLSPYLAQGVISARQCLKAVLDVLGAKRVQDIFLHQGPSVWLNEFVWREFYKHILYFYPRVSKNLPFKPETQRLAWQNDKGLFKAWCVGNTGFPIVDAAMRQLNATGWMHNRLRMITAMFLTKTLLINWQWGEQYFSEHLIDCDLSANNGGWQWSASTGTDAVPYFRIFNPTTQSQKYDPDGRFIRQYCPELSAFDNKSIHQPYAKQAELAKKSGYPPPIVDYKLNRELAISMFKSL